MMSYLTIVAEYEETMGRLKGGANNAEQVDKLSLRELNKLIAHADWRYSGAGLNSAMRKDAFECLVWQEAQRERLHGVPAPNRRAPRRDAN